ncbi:ShlB/FhaC/HecB family hemolysin secretion/activation protein [Aetokthonos hydrillicola Thurmond2011]|jgi:hemolysin activation/secretion protein|uniref:ShlB/FhaC/HecB family hemolysin secretion/activation protein n=1 Tax=Aetokthonos hydrillicola Thurmond2011 TaxID=2712845 RepID=A0AAP5I7N9_9CYAN|nr:ShlB/FhaC/HecB family hemolysin secretion/activation protein [Aetokthonos hydrillicola]MBO3457339.1 ShlB/FhaC/HecB family hemolysin secretion/activation protein [Aetokthonos hydrillicola CCALA 1050]MBW4586688.1 ShlB/FhaC/HecB family hemolysin secretion/activation protein [Aetokthonos hydrillicola CCALA 1050]MDR9893985.1 ShlB/FhaC/HecB family hemolysin secretion/activation protein [Aetokthonos hydrillicola Thurmond2011]
MFQFYCLKLNLTIFLVVGLLFSLYIDSALAQALHDSSLDTENSPLTPLVNINRQSFDITKQSVILSQLPNPITPRSPEPSKPTPQQPAPAPQTPLEVPPSNIPPSQNLPKIPGSITVSRFEFIGNTAFSNKKLTEITAKFTRKPITFAQLLEAEAAVTKLYTDAGYINSGAVIPANQIFSPKGAVVKIQIIEGGIEDIKVTGTRRLNPNYIRSRLKLASSKPLNRERLLEGLQLLQLNPLIKNISAELSAGSRPDLSLLEVKVVEANSFHPAFFADNARVPTVGSFRRGISINEGNALGFGDDLSFQYTNTDGSNAYDLSYTVPINAHNSTINFSAGLTDTQVVEPPFNRLNITGDSSYLDLSFRQPIIQTPNQELALGLTLSHEESQTKLFGENFLLSPGANQQGQTNISAVRFFQDYTQRSPREVFALHSQFSLGVGWFDATVHSQPPDSRFFAWRGQEQYVRLLAPDTLLVLRSDMQLSTRALVPLEQISVGGLQSVRGYRQDQLLTDNGFLASAEVRFPILRVKDVEGLLQVVPFLDFGVGWNSSGNRSPNRNTLVGLGVGLQWQMSNKFNARFDYGIPLIDVHNKGRTLQENGFYFSLNYSPF